jgi:Kelch motif
LSIDLTKSWTNATVTINTINKTVFSFNSAYLWPDASNNASFYQWGGQPSRLRLDWKIAYVPSTLYKFQADNEGGGEWTEQGQSSTSIFQNLRRGFGGAAASRDDIWYVVGGSANCGLDSNMDECSPFYPLGSMISYNSTSNLWTADSVQDFTASRTALWSQMHNIPSGSSNGLNIIFGGGTKPQGSRDLTNNPSDLLDFKHIYIYDPVTKTFHNQTATGTRPTPRIRFCSVGTPGSNGSYEIFVYGGFDPSHSAQQLVLASDEVFVLSLPGFVWFKADYPATHARIMHSCNIVGRGGSQMLVTGGVDPDRVLSKTDTTTDPWSNGINIFDLSAMRWKDSYEANDSFYQTPPIVRDWYTNNGPYPSWDYPAVESLFVRAPAVTPAVTPPVTPIPTEARSNPPNSTTAPPDRNTNTGAIAGGVTGGLAVLALVVAAVYYALIRRRQSIKRRRPELEASTNAEPRQLMHQEQLTPPEQELRDPSLIELQADDQRHEVDTRGSMVRHEIS